MKAYSDLANELGKLRVEQAEAKQSTYKSKIKRNTKGSPGNSHYGVDYTGKSRLATRKLVKVVSHCDYGEVCELLQQGADPRFSDSKGRTSLHFAACRGDSSIVQLLVASGASVNGQDNIGNTPLHLACTVGHVDVITVLLRSGTDLTYTDRRGHSPLHLALSRLKMLTTSPKIPYERKREMENIIEMMREYLKFHCQDTLINNDEMGELELLAGKLSLSETHEQVDEVQCLLQSLTELSIQKETGISDSLQSIK